MSKKGDDSFAVSAPQGPMVHKIRITKELTWESNTPIATQFQIVKELGRGAYGTVYEAVHGATGLRLAIKTVEKDQVSEEALKALEAEINILKAVHHPALVLYYGTAKHEADLWILLELAPLGSVRDVMKKLTRPLRENEASAVVFHALKGLQYLHSRQIIHRDIKAANILLNERGEAKIADFGVSTKLAKGENQTMNAKGTPIFMAPEVLRGEGGYSYPADVWALGITMIEMLEGDPPYLKLPMMRAMYKIMEDDPPRLAHPEQFSALCAQFIADCLVKDPAARTVPAVLLAHKLFQANMAALHLPTTMKDIVALRPAAPPTLQVDEPASVGLPGGGAGGVSRATVSAGSVPRGASSGPLPAASSGSSPSGSGPPSSSDPRAADPRAGSTLTRSGKTLDGDSAAAALELANVPHFRLEGRFEAQHATHPPAKIQCMSEIQFNDRALVAAGCRDGSLYLWGLDGAVAAHVGEAHEKEVKQLAVAQASGSAPDHLWSLGAESSKLWTLSEEKSLLSLVSSKKIKLKLAYTLALPKPTAPVSCQLELLTTSGQELWIGTLSNKIHIFDGPAKNCAYKQAVEITPAPGMKPAEVFVSCMCYHGGSIWVAVGPCLLRLDPHSKKIINYLEGRSKIISCLIGVGKNLWSAGHDMKIKVWDMNSGSQVCQLEQTSQVFALIYDGTAVWAACWDRSITWYDGKNFQLIKQLETRHTDSVTSFVLLRKTNQMWSGSWDKTAIVWK